MVINRGSLQRGFAYGEVYKSEFIELKEIVANSSSVNQAIINIYNVLLCLSSVWRSGIISALPFFSFLLRTGTANKIAS